MKTLITTLIFGLVACATVFTVQSCAENQLQRADRIAADANAAGQLAQQVATSPAAQVLIPAWLRAALEAAGVIAAGGVITWQQLRSKKLLEKIEAGSS